MVSLRSPKPPVLQSSSMEAASQLMGSAVAVVERWRW